MQLCICKGSSRVTHMLHRFLPEMPSGEISIALRGGVHVVSRLSDYNGLILFLFGTPERSVVEACCMLSDAGDTFLDVGANNGAVGMLVRRVVGPELHLVFVEPQRDLAGAIRKSATACGFAADVHAIAISDCSGEERFHVTPTHTGTGRIGEGEASVRCETMRSILDGLPDTPIGAKVDVEGAERHVLPSLCSDPRFAFCVVESQSEAARQLIMDVAHASKHVVYGIERSLLSWRLRKAQNEEELGDVVDAAIINTERVQDRPILNKWHRLKI